MNILAKELLKVARMLKVAVSDPDEAFKIMKDEGFVPEPEVDPDSKWNQKHNSPEEPKSMRYKRVPWYSDESQTGRMIKKPFDTESPESGIGKGAYEAIPHTKGTEGPKIRKTTDSKYFEEDIPADVIRQTDANFVQYLGGISKELQMLVQYVKELSEINIPLYEELKQAKSEMDSVPWQASSDWDGISHREAELMKSEFRKLYENISSYIAAVRPAITESKRVILIIDGVAFRFYDVYSKARAGVLAVLAENRDWLSEDDWREPGETDALIRKKVLRENLEKFSSKVKRLQSVMEKVHLERVAAEERLLRFKDYLKNVSFMFRNSMGQLVRIDADVVGRTEEVNNLSKAHGNKHETTKKKQSGPHPDSKNPYGVKSASVYRTAFSFGEVWDKIKEIASNAFNNIKDALFKVAKMIGIVEKSNDGVLEVASEIEGILDEIED